MSLVGVFLALAQVLDKDVAQVVRTSGGVERVWRFLGFAPLRCPQTPRDPLLLYIRLGSIVLLTLLIAILLGLGTHLQRWKARWRGSMP